MRTDALHKKIGKKFHAPPYKPQKLTEKLAKRIKQTHKIPDHQIKSKYQELIQKKRDSLKTSARKTGKKMRRVQSLINIWEPLASKMRRFITTGTTSKGMSLRARLAYGILLIMETGIRTGNETSAEGYICNNKHLKEFGKIIKTYGLTTIQVDHTQTNSTTLFLNFTGKKGVNNILDTNEPYLRKYYDILIKHKKPSDRLLDIDYLTLKSFVKKNIGARFTPKDIRTAAVNLKFIQTVKSLSNLRPVNKKGEAKRIVKSIIEHTANEIGHTPGVCKGAYLSPTLVLHIEQMLYRKKEK